jgi:hypothetical protein
MQVSLTRPAATVEKTTHPKKRYIATVYRGYPNPVPNPVPVSGANSSKMDRRSFRTKYGAFRWAYKNFG